MVGLFGVCFAGSASVVAAQDAVELETSASFNTTYVFRGSSQYSDKEIPSLQLDVNGDYSMNVVTSVWSTLSLITALNERETNAELGVSEELIVGAGVSFDVQSNKKIRVGALGFFRPEATPVDVRKEVMLGLEWLVRDDKDWRIEPYAEVYGEVHRGPGAYGEVGLHCARKLNHGFLLAFGGYGGGSQYTSQNDSFRALAGGKLSLTYQVDKVLEVSGHFNGSLSNDTAKFSTDFLEKYGTFWSGLTVRYRPEL